MTTSGLTLPLDRGYFAARAQVSGIRLMDQRFYPVKKKVEDGNFGWSKTTLGTAQAFFGTVKNPFSDNSTDEQGKFAAIGEVGGSSSSSSFGGSSSAAGGGSSFGGSSSAAAASASNLNASNHQREEKKTGFGPMYAAATAAGAK